MEIKVQIDPASSFVRRYSSAAEQACYEQQVVDIPVTASIEDENFYFSLRRDENLSWSLICSEEEKIELANHLKRVGLGQQAIDQCESAVFKMALSEVSTSGVILTRRDAIEHVLCNEPSIHVLCVRDDTAGVNFSVFIINKVSVVACKWFGTDFDRKILDVADINPRMWVSMAPKMIELYKLDKQGLIKVFMTLMGQEQEIAHES